MPTAGKVTCATVTFVVNKTSTKLKKKKIVKLRLQQNNNASYLRYIKKSINFLNRNCPIICFVSILDKLLGESKVHGHDNIIERKTHCQFQNETY